MGRVWLEAATLAHTERAVPLSKIHSPLTPRKKTARSLAYRILKGYGPVGSPLVEQLSYRSR